MISKRPSSTPSFSKRSVYTALAWTAIHAALCALWLYNGRFPLGQNDPNPEYSLLGNLAPQLGAFVGLAMSLLGLVIARAMLGNRRWLWPARLYTGLLLIIIIAGVVDYRVLGNVAYVILGRFSQINTTALYEVFCIVGAFVWSLALLSYNRSQAGAGKRGLLSPTAAAKWAPYAVLVAVIIPVFYAFTRIMWALDVPFGISQTSLNEGKADHMWLWGAGLGLLAVGGAILTVGLIRPWGEIFPRWIPGLRGHRVPPAVAIIPASLVAIMVFSAGLMIIRVQLTQDIAQGNWATVLPEMLWPLWGIALALATFAYYIKRQSKRN